MDVITYAKLKKRIATLEGIVDNIPSPFSYKGSVTSETDLPAQATKGDMYTVTSVNAEYVYDGTNWVKLVGVDSITTAQIDSLFN